MPSKEVRDPLHGLMVLGPKEWSIIDTPPFQRLRGIQQLAMTHLVYPGARHSRFEHCLGACHLAGRVAEKLELQEDRKELVRIAGLVHDIGHGPFSHVSEEVLEKHAGREKVHEAISSSIVRLDPDLRAAMGDALADEVADLLLALGEASHRTVERDIVAGASDVDKLDYLLRDSHYCGVKYGEYDLEKVIESVRVVESQLGNQTYLAFDQDGVFALEEMLLARYHMNRQVYGHKTRVATDRMLVRAMELAIDEEIVPVDLFKPPDPIGIDYVNEFLKWNDAQVTGAMLSQPSSKSGQMMNALSGHRLMKRVLEFDWDELVGQFGAADAGFIAEPQASLDSLLPEVEASIASSISTDPMWVVLHWQHLKSPISERFSFKLGETDILLQRGNEQPVPFNQVSQIFSETEHPARINIALYARLPDDASPSELNESDLTRIRDATMEGLRKIGSASAEV